jgi:hypothetical protein
MSGLRSRRKGLSQEYRLRDALRSWGWEADRVPSSGAAEGFPGDIRAKKDDKELLFELKARKDSFGSLYDMYDDHLKVMQDDLLSVVVPTETLLLPVEMSTSLEAVLEGSMIKVNAPQHPVYRDHQRAFNRLPTVFAWLKSSDILVLKDDRRPYLFLRFPV